MKEGRREGGREGGRGYIPVWVPERSLVGDQRPRADESSECVSLKGSQEEKEKNRHVRD